MYTYNIKTTNKINGNITLEDVINENYSNTDIEELNTSVVNAYKRK